MSFKISTNLVDACFRDCVTSWNDDNVTSYEQACLANCGKRTTKLFEATSSIKPQQQRM